MITLITTIPTATPPTSSVRPTRAPTSQVTSATTAARMLQTQLSAIGASGLYGAMAPSMQPAEPPRKMPASVHTSGGRAVAARMRVGSSMVTSVSPDQYYCAVVVVCRRHPVDELVGALAEPSGDQAFGLAQELVDADREVPTGDLDQPVGEEQQGVAAVEPAALADELRVREHAQNRSLARVQHTPPARSGGELHCRRMPGRRHDVLPRGEIDGYVRDGGEALVPLLPEEVAVRRAQEDLRRHRSEQAAERARKHQGAGAGVDTLAVDVDQRDLDRRVLRGVVGDEEVT